MRRPLLLLCVAFVPLLGGSALAAVAAGADPHNLPIGKSVSTTGPARRSIDACAVMSGGGGAFASGSWIHADGTFDVTAKPTVKGDVAWPNASITFTTVNGRLTVKSNGLPKGTRTGIYPVAAAPRRTGTTATRTGSRPSRWT
jgi:hypothetical protein